MDLTFLGKAVLVLGWLLGTSGLPRGPLPRDLGIQWEDMSCFMPITSMILLSLILTIVLNILLRLFNR